MHNHKMVSYEVLFTDETDAKMIKDTDLNKKYYLILGTWNVRRLYEEGAVKTLEAEAKWYRMDIIAIQETHIKETKVTELEEYVLFTSGAKTRRYEDFCKQRTERENSEI